MNVQLNDNNHSRRQKWKLGQGYSISHTNLLKVFRSETIWLLLVLLLSIEFCIYSCFIFLSIVCAWLFVVHCLIFLPFVCCTRFLYGVPNVFQSCGVCVHCTLWFDFSRLHKLKTKYSNELLIIYLKLDTEFTRRTNHVHCLTYFASVLCLIF